jgi:hypothetical protein
MKKKKDKLTYRNEITFCLACSVSEFFHLNFSSESQLSSYMTRQFLNNVKVPDGTYIGGKITKRDNIIIECTIIDNQGTYYGKVRYLSYPNIPI